MAGSTRARDEITYDRPKAAKAWVADEVAAGRLPDIPRSDEDIDALFTTENIVKHMVMKNGPLRGSIADGFGGF